MIVVSNNLNVQKNVRTLFLKSRRNLVNLVRSINVFGILRLLYSEK